MSLGYVAITVLVGLVVLELFGDPTPRSPVPLRPRPGVGKKG